MYKLLFSWLNTILLGKTTTCHGALFEYIDLVKFALTTIYNQNHLGWQTRIPFLYNIPVGERISNMCNEHIGDEFHYLFICKSPEQVRIRENLFPEY
jgi:hypothetical protein